MNALEVTCAACSQRNRIPRARAADGPRCGRCKRPLFSGRPVDVAEATWGAEVERAGVPVLVDFWAPWCGPCRMVAPALEDVARRYPGRVKVVKVNIDENPRLAERHGVRSIPTMLVLDRGREVDRLVGALPASEIERRLAAVA